MKKSVCSLLAMATIAFSLVGCQRQIPTDLLTLDTTITWWNDYAQEGTEAETQRYDYVQGVIEEFNKIYPNIKIVQENHESYGKIASDINTGLSAGNIPNMASVYPDPTIVWDETPDAILHTEEYFNDSLIGFGRMNDAQGNVTSDESTAYSDIQSSIESEKSGYGEGPLLTLPYSRSSEALFINQTVFDKEGAGLCGNDSADEVMGDLEKYKAPVAAASKKKYAVPTDWEDMIALARQMKTDFPTLFDGSKDEYGYFKAMPICYDSGDNLFITFCKMMGIDYTDSKSVLFNNDDAKAMMVQLKKWNNEGLIGTADQLPIKNPQEGWHEYSTSVVNYGQVFMLISSTTSGMYMGVDGYRVGVYQTPTVGADDMPDVTFSDKVSKTGEHYAISQGPSLVLFRNADENVQKATFMFYKFLTNTENGAGLSATTGYFPVRQSSNDTPTLKTIIDAADSTINDKSNNDADLTAKMNKYKGLSYRINEQYNEQDDYFIAPINEHSASCRTAVGELVNTIFNTPATTDDEIEALVENSFKTAYSAAIG